METSLSFSIWGVLVGLGCFHGVFLAIVMLSKRDNKQANTLFALLLLAVSYNLFEYMIAISHKYGDFPHILATSYPFLYLMGPLYFFYVKKLTGDNYKIGVKGLLHLLPALVCLLLLTPLYMSSAQEKIGFLQTLGESGDHIEIPMGQYLFMASHFIQTFIYLLAANRVLKSRERLFKENLSDNGLVHFSILRQMTVIFFWFIVLCLVVLSLLPVIKQYRVEMDYGLVLTLSVLIHVIGYVGLRQPWFFEQIPDLTDKKKYSNYKLTEGQSSEIYQKIVDRIEQDRLYLISDYKISDLSDATEIPSHYLSQVVNETSGKNFFEFINSFRVRKAQELLEQDIDSNLKIMAVAFDSGFSNKSTFNRTFKKHTGYTPSQYKEKFL